MTETDRPGIGATVSAGGVQSLDDADLHASPRGGHRVRRIERSAGVDRLMDDVLADAG